MAEITKELVEKLAKLARLELAPTEIEKFTTDLSNILAHVKELESVDTKNVTPMTGGTMLKNVMREDVREAENEDEKKNIIDAFPDKQGGYLKTPAVFE